MDIVATSPFLKTREPIFSFAGTKPTTGSSGLGNLFSLPLYTTSIEKNCFSEPFYSPGVTDNYEQGCIDFGRILNLDLFDAAAFSLEDTIKTLTDFVFEMQLNFFTRIYLVDNKKLLKEYLLNRPGISEKLFEANLVIKEIFGESIKVVLSVNNDINLGNYLLCSILATDDDLSESLKKMERFDSDWLIENLKTIKNELVFQIE